VLQDGRVEILDANGEAFLYLQADGGPEDLLANAGRLMVCVNFCSGAPTEDLDYIFRLRRSQLKETA
jgi:hypothetical protein